MGEMDDITVGLDEIESFNEPCVLAIGMYDGLHKGHMSVMKRTLKLAESLNALPCVLTFSPHPSTVIDMGRPPVKMMYAPEIRAQMFRDVGIKKVFVKNFTPHFAGLSPASFEKFLRDKFPNLRGIITGENFLFGRNADGNLHTLKSMAEKNGWVYEPIKGVRLGLRRISSSRMREALRKGGMALFRRMAGREYAAEGAIKSGKRLGRKIGFPTLNLPWNPECKPPYGVYAVELVRNGDDKIYRGVANYGVSPTTGETEPLVEVHLFEDVSFGPRTKVKVYMLKFLRGEKKFANIDILKSSIEKDVKRAKKFFNRR